MDKAFSLQYSRFDYDEMLFALGDLSHWIIVSRDQVDQTIGRGQFPLNIKKSDSSKSRYTAVSYNRGPSEPADPWFSNQDNTLGGAITSTDNEDFSMLYGENGSKGLVYWLSKHNGADVYIRNSTNPQCPPSISANKVDLSSIYSNLLSSTGAGTYRPPKIFTNSSNCPPTFTYTVSPNPISFSGGSIDIVVQNSNSPTYDFRVCITGANLKLSRCELLFPAGGISKYTLTVQFLASAKVSSSLQFTVCDSRDSGYKFCPTLTVPVNPPSSTSFYAATCSSSGDPHYLTFDHKTYDYYGTGDFYLVRTDDAKFVVQNRLRPCAAVSCNHYTAVKHGSDVFHFKWENGQRLAYKASKDFSNDGTKIVQSSPSDYSLTFPDGFKVTLSLISWGSNGYYTNVNVMVPGSYMSQTKGLCGTFDNNANNDLQTRPATLQTSGTVITDVQAFVNSWRVPDEENLFIRPDTATFPSYAAAVANTLLSCWNNRSVAILPDSVYTPSNDVTAIVLQNTPAPFDKPENEPFDPNPVLKWPSDGFKQQALQQCGIINSGPFRDACINLGVSQDVLNKNYQDCLFDVQATGCLEAATQVINTLYRICIQRPFTHPSLNPNTQVPIALACPGGCSGLGTCTAGKCVCQKGFSGDDCSVRQPLPQCPPSFIMSISPDPITITAPATSVQVTISTALPPAADFKVCITGVNVRLSQCQLLFSSYVSQVTITVSFLSSSTVSGQLQLKICESSNADFIYCPVQTFVVNAKLSTYKLRAATCSSLGDPHYVTFDHRPFDYYLTGDFYLVRTDDAKFVVQNRLKPCASVTCNHYTAVKYGDDVFHFRWDNGNRYVYKASSKPVSSGVSLTQTSPSDYTLSFADGFRVTISLASYSSSTGTNYYTNVNVLVPGTTFGLTKGLCGVFNDDVRDDYESRPLLGQTRGKPLPDVKALFDSWRVPDRENLFINPDTTAIPVYVPATATKLTTCNSANTDIIPDPVPPTAVPNDVLSNVCSATKQTASSYTDLWAANPNPVWPTEGFRLEAEKQCEILIKGPFYDACTSTLLLSPDLLQVSYKNCIFDVQITQDLNAATAVISSLHRVCLYRQLTSLQLSPDTQIPEAVACPGGCCGLGKCVQGRCQCKQGFSGSDCSIRPPLTACPASFALTLSANPIYIPSSGSTDWVIQNNIAPTAPFRICLDGTNVQVSKCDLPFSLQSTSRFSLKVSFLTNSKIASSLVLKYCWSTDSAYQYCPSQTIQVLPQNNNVRSASCTSYVDPHFNTFDGRGLDYYGTGDFYMVRTDDAKFVIQNRYKPCGGTSCIHYTAIKYGDEVFHFRIEENGERRGFRASSAPPSGLINVAQYSTYDWYLTFADGYNIRIILQSSWTNIYVTVPYSTFKRTKGVCGTFDDNNGNDLELRPAYGETKGTVVGDVNSFVESWRVPDNENLFVNPDTKAIPIYALPPVVNVQFTCTYNRSQYWSQKPQVDSWNNQPKDVTNKFDSKTVITIGDKPYNVPYIPNGIPPAWYSEFVRQTVETQCYTLTTGPLYDACLKLGVTIERMIEFYQNCQFDARVTGTVEAALGVIFTAHQMCIQQVGNNPQLPPGQTIPPAIACPGGCTGNGICINSQCLCNEGYGGVDCSILPQPPPCPEAFKIKVSPNPLVFSGKDKIEIVIDSPQRTSSYFKVCLTGMNLRLSQCLLHFPNSAQTKYTISASFLSSSKFSAALHFKVCDSNSGEHIYCPAQVVPVAVPENADSKYHAGTCTSHGDPHYVTFDHSLFDYYGTGDFYLVRTDDAKFVVQTRIKPCGTTTCNHYAAIKMNADVYIFRWENGVRQVYKASRGPSQSQVWIRSLSAGFPTNDYTLTFQEGFRVIVNFHSTSTGFYFINLHVMVPGSYIGKTKGICGTFNDDAGDEFYARPITGQYRGPQLPTVDALFESWRVPNEENLFLNPDTTSIPNYDEAFATTLLTCNYANVSVVPEPMPVPNTPFEVTNAVLSATKQTSGQYQENFVFNGDKLWPTDGFQNEAIQQCDDLIKGVVHDACVAVGVSDDLLQKSYENCLFDARLFGDLNAATALVASIHRICVYRILTNPTIAPNTQLPLALNCPSGCNGRGICSNAKCICDVGFSGPDCSVRPTLPSCPASFSLSISPNPIQGPTSAPNVPVDVVITNNIPPTSDFRVCLTGTNIRLSKCSLHFPAGAMSRFVIQLSYLNSAKLNTALEIKVCQSKDVNFAFCPIQKITVSSSGVNYRSGSCHITKGSHYLTYDMRAFDYFGTGDFYLVRTEDAKFVVQARLRPCKTTTCNQLTAVKFGSDVYHFSWDSGVRKVYRASSKVLSGLSSVAQTSTSDYTVSTADGHQVHISLLDCGTNCYYINLNVIVSGSAWSKTRGLCGTLDDNANNDLTTRSGTLAADENSFVENWRVGDNENLFILPDTAAIQVFDTAPASPLTTCTFNFKRYQDMIYNPLIVSFKDITDTIPQVSKLALAAYSEKVTISTPAWSSEALRLQALKECGYINGNNGAVTAFRDACTNAGVPTAILDRQNLNCLTDVQVIGDITVATNAIRATHRLCLNRQMTTSVAGMGLSAQLYCKGACSGLGTCTSGVCICAAGYTGVDCSIRLPTPTYFLAKSSKNFSILRKVKKIIGLKGVNIKNNVAASH